MFLGELNSIKQLKAKCIDGLGNESNNWPTHYVCEVLWLKNLSYY